MSLKFYSHDLMRCSFERGIEIQNELAESVKNYPHEIHVLTLEHPLTITAGKNASESDLITSKNDLMQKGIFWIETDRGGKLTMHMPGQILVYVICHVKYLNLTLKSFLNLLTQSTLEMLSHYQTDGVYDTSCPGIWVQGKKIGALGLRIKNHITQHGIAINIQNDLNVYQHIVPCGLRGKGVTSVFAETGTKISVEEVSDKINFYLRKNFDGLQLKN